MGIKTSIDLMILRIKTLCMVGFIGTLDILISLSFLDVYDTVPKTKGSFTRPISEAEFALP